jgi:hypothetical protein
LPPNPLTVALGFAMFYSLFIGGPVLAIRGVWQLVTGESIGGALANVTLGAVYFILALLIIPTAG